MSKGVTKGRVKPKVFVASSSESLNLANAVQENLQHDSDVTIWSQASFDPGDVIIDSLLEIVERNDFGVFVFARDDLTEIRGKKQGSVRDNVLFELGIFMGRRGRKHCVFIVPSHLSDFRLASDLGGIITAVYDEDFAERNALAALGPACHQITRVLEKLSGGPQTASSGRQLASLRESFASFAQFNVNHPLTLVRTTVIVGKQDVDLEIIDASDRARDLFGLRHGEDAPVGYHMADIIKQFSKFVDRKDLRAFDIDQRRIRKVYSQGDQAIAYVPVKLNGKHKVFPHKSFLPMAIAYGKDCDEGKSSLAVIMYLDIGFLSEREF